MDYNILKWEPEVLADTGELANQIIVEIESIFEDTPTKWGIIGIAAADEPHTDRTPSEWVLGLVSGVSLDVAETIMSEIRLSFPAFKRQDKLGINKEHESTVQIFICLPHESLIHRSIT